MIFKKEETRSVGRIDGSEGNQTSEDGGWILQRKVCKKENKTEWKAWDKKVGKGEDKAKKGTENQLGSRRKGKSGYVTWH